MIKAVVFDAYKVKGNVGEVERVGDITVVYTKEAQTADAYIEKAARELSKNYGDVDLRRILAHPRCIALGEIGIDYHYTKENKEVQKQLFIRQIELANEFNLPILIHMRDATLDTIEILKAHPCKGIMHCYSGSLDTAKILVNMGYYISFAGPITFKNAKDAPEVCKWVPNDRLFVETDAPFLTPHPFRGKQNEPAYVEHVLNKICEIRDMDYSEVVDITTNNVFRLFDK